jgi:hypothetical protein
MAGSFPMPTIQHWKWKKHITSSYAKTEHQKKTSKNTWQSLNPITGIIQHSPIIKKAVLLILLRWREGKNITPSDHPSIFGIREAIKDQNNGLGWDNFVF